MAHAALPATADITPAARAFVHAQACMGRLEEAALAGDLRMQVQATAGAMAALRSLGRLPYAGSGSARDAILAYLRQNLGEVVEGAELEAVSGISEYGRRIRELRMEGWRIVGGTTEPVRADLRILRKAGTGPVGPTQYVLVSARRRRIR